MIAAVEGRLEGRGVDHALINVGGIVLRVLSSITSLRDLGEVGSSVRLQTYLLVREDALQLYGFASSDELRLFETLLGVTGIGPRLALSILSFGSPAQIQAAILGEDTVLLSKVPGVGKKTAARIILELRGKLTAAPTIASGSGVAADPITNDVLEALQALGYTSAEAIEAVKSLGDEVQNLSAEQRVFAALRQLSR